jgi:hypothetical protein
VWIFQEEDETGYGEPGLKQLYYVKIPPYYLTEVLELVPGEYYEYDVEISWYNSGELIVVGWTASFTIM